jgi:hypothetical protein
MIRLALLATATAGLLIPAYLDDPSNYEHDALLPTTSAAAVTSTTGAVVVGTSEAPQASPTSSTTVTSTARLLSTVPAISTTTIPGSAKCPDWWGYAATFWPAHMLEVVDQIIWQESRCQADAISSTRDYGLMQINWATWGPMVTDLGLTRDDLLVPAVNIMVGRMVAVEAERLGWCSFQPWYMSGDWCS